MGFVCGNMEVLTQLSVCISRCFKNSNAEKNSYRTIITSIEHSCARQENVLGPFNQ